jgi:hypothetical protein
MKSGIAIAIAIALALGWIAAACPGTAMATPSPEPKERPIMYASGTFEVKLEPQKADNPQAEAAGLSRLSIAKQYHGTLEAASNGEMLAVGDGKVSGAYVAIEKVTGSLQGRSGSFALVHSAVMRHGAPENWSVTVVPDSGTEQLAGLSGTMTIQIDGDRHAYELSYTLPES